MKVFVGLDLPPDVRAALATVLGDLPIPGRPTPPANWHVTLRYIGAMDEVSVERLLAGLDEAELQPPFRLVTDGLGAFPKPSKATVLWLGFRSGTEVLTQLATTVDDIVERIGHGREDRPFAAHLTLSRVRPPCDVRELIRGVELPSIAIPVDAVTVFESRNVDGGVEYRTIEQFTI